jgi:hypothetical protein
MTTDHIDIETLSAFADSELNAVQALRVERHVAACGSCSRALERVRTLVASAKALPREVAAPPEVWAAIRGRVPSPASRVPRRWWHNGYLAAAAGIVLVVGTASLMLLAGPNSKAKAAKLASTNAVQVPVVLTAVEQNYAPTLAELRSTLDSQRHALSPSTVRTLERSLALIDSAIAEARTALQADPGSGALVDLLSMSYQRKVEFLRRATTLSSSL